MGISTVNNYSTVAFKNQYATPASVNSQASYTTYPTTYDEPKKSSGGGGKLLLALTAIGTTIWAIFKHVNFNKLAKAAAQMGEEMKLKDGKIGELTQNIEKLTADLKGKEEVVQSLETKVHELLNPPKKNVFKRIWEAIKGPKIEKTVDNFVDDAAKVVDDAVEVVDDVAKAAGDAAGAVS